MRLRILAFEGAFGRLRVPNFIPNVTGIQALLTRKSRNALDVQRELYR